MDWTATFRQRRMPNPLSGARLSEGAETIRQEFYCVEENDRMWNGKLDQFRAAEQLDLKKLRLDGWLSAAELGFKSMGGCAVQLGESGFFGGSCAGVVRREWGTYRGCGPNGLYEALTDCC